MRNANHEYMLQKLREARCSLMAPHAKGEDHSFRQASFSLQTGFTHLDGSPIEDQETNDRIGRLRRLLAIGISDLTFDQRADFAGLVDQLANWFSENLGD